MTYRQAMEAASAAYFAQLLAKHRYVARAAREAGVSRQHLYRLLRKQRLRVAVNLCERFRRTMNSSTGFRV